MIVSFSSDNAESRFYNRPAPRTDHAEDRGPTSICDRGKGNGSRTFPNVLHVREAYQSIRISFSNSRAPWAVSGALINEGGR